MTRSASCADCAFSSGCKVRKVSFGIIQAGENVHATSPAIAVQKGWMRYVLPSVADLVFLILLTSLSVGVLAHRLLNDAGIGWHIRNGELILSTHAITRADPFSSTVQGQTWYAWEWLYDVVIAVIHGWWGLNGVVFFPALILATTFALTFRLTLLRGGNLATTMFLLLLSMGAATVHFLARPHVLSWLFVVLWFYVLDSSESNPAGGRRLFWLPVLMLFWVNLHGGFLTGFFLLGLYLLSSIGHRLLSHNLGRRQLAGKRMQRLGLVTLLSLAASLLNPYGYKLYDHIHQYLGNRFLIDHIDEFLPPNFHGVAQQCFLLLVLLTIVVLATARTKLRSVELLIVIFAVASGMYATRNVPVSSILLTLVVTPLLGYRSAENNDVDPKRGDYTRGTLQYFQSLTLRMVSMEHHLRGHLWPVVGVLTGVWICAHAGLLGSSEIMAARFSEKRFPVEAVKVIRQRRVPGPFFVPDYWGGYLIYELYPQARVAVDDRHDLYGEQFFRDYLKVVKVEPGWEEVLKKNNADWVLMPPQSPLAGALSSKPDWSLEYRDDVAALLRRKSAP
jgi:hypothetical protein